MCHSNMPFKLELFESLRPRKKCLYLIQKWSYTFILEGITTRRTVEVAEVVLIWTGKKLIQKKSIPWTKSSSGEARSACFLAG